MRLVSTSTSIVIIRSGVKHPIIYSLPPRSPEIKQSYDDDADELAAAAAAAAANESSGGPVPPGIRIAI